jgi:hypothetical protein
MAFNRNKFLSVNGQPGGITTLNEWKYVTADGVDEMATADYFRDVQGSLAVGDLIHTFLIAEPPAGSNANWFCGKTMLCVRMSDSSGGHVAALPVSTLDGMGVVKNIPAGDATTIAMATGLTIYAAYAILTGGVDSAGGSNVITVKNGATTLFSATIDGNTADGSVIPMVKSAAAAALFDANEFGVENSGAAAQAHGIVTVVLLSEVTPPPAPDPDD